VYFSINGGGNWMQLKGGLPTIAVKDMEIQKRESDLVIATFGRGFYVMDDYSPLRNLKKEDMQKTAFISPIKKAWMYMESTPLGVRGKGFQGESYWNAPNPKPASVFTYYLKSDLKTLIEKRQELEKEKIKKGEAPFYPTIDSLRLEDAQPAPYLLFTITDADGNVVRRLKAPAKKGISRISWDFRDDAKNAITYVPFDESNVFNSPPRGIFVLPGDYQVSLSKFEDGIYSELVSPQPFTIEALNIASMTATDRKALNDFGKKVAELKRGVDATNGYAADLNNKIKYIKEAALRTPGIDQGVIKDIASLEKRLVETGKILNGDASLSKREFEAPTSISLRITGMMEGLLNTTTAPTTTSINSYTVSAQQFAPILAEVKTIGDEVKKIENLLEQKGAPYTPGRVPDWKMK
jgi:hypothetical protein